MQGSQKEIVVEVPKWSVYGAEIEQTRANEIQGAAKIGELVPAVQTIERI